MVKLRLARGGRKKRPLYKIVAAHSQFKRDGRFLEKLGNYNPLAPTGEEITLKEDRVLYWLMNGARPTDTARNIFSRKGIMLRYDMLKNGIDEKEIDAAVVEFLKHKEVSIAKREDAKDKKRLAKPKPEAKAAPVAKVEEKSDEAVAEDVKETDAAIESAAEAEVPVAKVEVAAEEIQADESTDSASNEPEVEVKDAAPAAEEPNTAEEAENKSE